MLEFDTNTIAYMTAALENACRDLKNDTTEGRTYIADRLEECAKAGRTSKFALNQAAQKAVAELNGSRGVHSAANIIRRLKGYFT